MGSQDQHREQEPQTDPDGNLSTASTRDIADRLTAATQRRQEQRAKSIRDAAAIDQHRRVVAAQRTPGAIVPTLDTDGGDVA